MRVSISQLRRIIREAADAAVAVYPAWIDELPDNLKTAAKRGVDSIREEQRPDVQAEQVEELRKHYYKLADNLPHWGM